MGKEEEEEEEEEGDNEEEYVSLLGGHQVGERDMGKGGEGEEEGEEGEGFEHHYSKLAVEEKIVNRRKLKRLIQEGKEKKKEEGRGRVGG